MLCIDETGDRALMGRGVNILYYFEKHALNA
jgi:hypothetical protein